ncbi:hypothetical protein AJ85_17290 [Alkalihalobacillus alcalophilus ATCC 27647 = CGMCC 1.3604]|uniref:Uncharacterized protein n=1 Tax=Alkalihalobacillus alcalophilus ATCC 27647 = CGMCC 1.3604 TaxID=1218173 RepID=A0A094YTZ8_ALKAL|nr:DUF4352 domain-containing protein [Alkalihalobacillus alcalophilus]KGA96957.1 hypothetical protein BALCAV_0213110 [Alkalihalobacillus alcalophilus ATCC 27647 = CGMCC 1.3604]MED1561344.1 DUF4352 domain-containing protein [Alkalihalobacillus alcalophilus]THG89509.1 hypothetical protein AJ85_17290 [Alkalihalobacillus alcalophilus ATCC 27647 = CGMCC 1.3604]
MKKTMKAIGILLLVGCLLIACNSDEGSVEAENGLIDNDNTGSETSGDGEEDSLSKEDSETSDSNRVASTGEYEDQVDLIIGDTAQIASTIGEFEISIDSVEYTEEQIDGEGSLFDAWIIADITVTNIGETVLAPDNTIGVLEITSNLDGSGAPDYSSQFDSIDGLEGELQPGETVSGQALFVIRDREEQYIRVNSGLVAAGGVKNNAIWTFETSEAKE